MRISRSPLPLLLTLQVALLSCGPGDATSSALAGVRDTLPDGTVRVRHALADLAVEPTVTSLRIGSVEGDPAASFGDVRGVEVGEDGSVWVLDAQATELRVFEAAGSFRGTVAREGGGPGELNRVNGLLRDREGTVWVNDHGHQRMIGFGPDGREVGRLPRVTPLRWGYIWGAVLDERGRFWQSVSHSARERTAGPPPEGLQTSPVRRYMKVLDPATESVDSVLIGPGESRSWVISMENGWSMVGIPFSPGPLLTVDPAGGFWSAWSAEYRIARLDEAGDTVLVIEGDVEPAAVTDEDREAWVRGLTRDGERPGMRGPAEEVLTAAPAVHPVLRALHVDDRGRLWVGRTVPEDQPPVYDIFDRDGNRLASLRLSETVLPYLPPTIRDGAFYSVTRDELDVPYVVRIDLPETLAASP